MTHTDPERVVSTKEAFAHHQILEQTPHSWVLQELRPDRWMEVVSLAGGKILAHGDYDPIVFAYGPRDPVAKVHWIGKDTLSHYVIEKAQIGSGQHVIEWNPTLAQQELSDYMRAIDEEDHPGRAAEYQTVIEAGWETEEELHRLIYDFDTDPPDFGRQPTSSLYMAWGILNRLSGLLAGKETP